MDPLILKVARQVEYTKASRVEYVSRYARVLLAMSMDDAKRTLGFKPNESPSKEEVIKAYRAKALANHPDRGGDPEKMVEVNVAKDILEGKARAKGPSKGPSTTEDPEEIKRRKAEIRKKTDIGFVELELEKASRVMTRALSDLSFIDAVWKADLKGFLTDDYADTLDVIHDEAVSGTKNADMGKAVKAVKDLSSTALRLASKFGSLRKKLTHVQDEPTVEGVSALYAEVSKFVVAFAAHRKESGKFMSLVSTSEDVPVTWVEVYGDMNQRVLSYDYDFQRFTGSSLKALEDQVEMSVDAVTTRLERDYGIDEGKFPEWKKWRIPADFQLAIDLIY